VFEHCGVKDVIVVVLPNERTAIHLDMIFTQLDRELCCVYPPHFVGPERLAVLHRRKKSKGVKEMPNFFAAMQAVDHHSSRCSAAVPTARCRSGSNGPQPAISSRCDPA